MSLANSLRHLTSDGTTIWPAYNQLLDALFVPTNQLTSEQALFNGQRAHTSLCGLRYEFRVHHRPQLPRYLEERAAWNFIQGDHHVLTFVIAHYGSAQKAYYTPGDEFIIRMGNVIAMAHGALQQLPSPYISPILYRLHGWNLIQRDHRYVQWQEPD